MGRMADRGAAAQTRLRDSTDEKIKSPKRKATTKLERRATFPCVLLGASAAASRAAQTARSKFLPGRVIDTRWQGCVGADKNRAATSGAAGSVSDVGAGLVVLVPKANADWRMEPSAPSRPAPGKPQQRVCPSSPVDLCGKLPRSNVEALLPPAQHDTPPPDSSRPPAAAHNSNTPRSVSALIHLRRLGIKPSHQGPLNLHRLSRWRVRPSRLLPQLRAPLFGGC